VIANYLEYQSTRILKIGQWVGLFSEDRPYGQTFGRRR